ncbi:MAG: EamA family transporter [Thermodesulfobacteriota bacterium]|nr:EamA family transporter [Thermodesulfobacteriota bacterium]
MKNFILFSASAIIWGSTWLAIKFQLGLVDPIISVSYRFILASFILLLFCRISGLNLKYNVKEHLFIALQGFFLFGINYWLVYLAEVHLPSGLVAVIFSMIIFFNIFNGAIFVGSPIRVRVIAGAALGIVGIGLVFKQELLSFSLSSDNSLALVIAGLGALTASLGNITSVHNQKINLPVIQTNAFGMMYGALFMLIISLIMGKHFSFEISYAYISSLLYLSVFGSIIAFTCYLTLLGKIGADKAAYVTLIIPVIALILSTIFEEYTWTLYAFIGVALILIGNMLVLIKVKR